MDIMRALSFPFDDEDWPVKIVIGAFMMLLAVLGLFLPFVPLGYQLYVTRQVIRGEKRPLPGMNEIGKVLTDGFMAFIALVVYNLPLTLFGCCLAMMGTLLGESDLGILLFVCLTLCLSGFLIPFILIATALYTMGLIRYGETGNFSAFIYVGDLWADTRANLGVLVLLWLYLLGLLLVGVVLLSISLITCVGVPLVAFYLWVVSGHLIGQAGVQTADNK